MPYFTKTIAVHFVDREGNNVEFITGLPAYIWADNAKPTIEFDSKKVLVLRSLPIENAKKISKSNSSIANFNAPPTPNASSKIVYQTNLGKIFLRVFSGQAGEIKYTFSGLGSAFPFSLKSKFDDIDQVTIPCQSIDSLKSKTNSIVFDKNENNEVSGVNVNKIIVPIDDLTPTTLDFKSKGFNYLLKGSKYPLQMEYQNGLGISKIKKEIGFEFQHIFLQSELEDTISVRLVDKKIFRTPWEEIKLEKGRLIFREGNFPIQKFKVKFLLSPTFFQMAKGFSEVNYIDGNFKLSSNNENLYFDSYFIDNSRLINDNLSGLKFNIISSINSFLTATRDQKLIHEFLPKGFVLKDNESIYYQVPLEINSIEIFKSFNKTIDIAPIQNGLILRAINYKLSGIPWVEASLVKNEDITIALNVKQIISNPVNLDFFKNLTDKDINLKPNMVMDKVISKKLNQLFPVKKELDYFLLNGSWYNANARSFSDSAGYLILNSADLIPDKKYTLFLWCRSLDEIKPDKEISFIAQKGITDLGAIRFD
jgi:hypothetical protein